MSERENANADLIERIARLEGRLDEDQRSPTKLVSVWGGLVALVLSIMIGGFQIFEFTVLRQKDARDRNFTQLSEYVGRISEINSEMASKAILATTLSEQARVAAEGKIVNAEKASIVRLASRLLEENPDIGGFASYITLTYELLSQGDNATALAFAQSALQKSRTAPERIESTRYVAQTLFAPGETQDIDLARETFQGAIDLAKLEKSYLLYQLIANSYSNMIVAEVQFGSCDKAQLAIQNLTKDMALSKSPIILQSALAEINFGLRGQTYCTDLQFH